MNQVDFSTVQFVMMILMGLGIFLYGISALSKSIKKIAGSNLKSLINKFAKSRIASFFSGLGFTAIIHSSAGTTALAIGLVRAGVLSMVSACAIIIGANVGTTITSFIVSIPISEYMAPVLLIGAFIILLTAKKKWVNLGEVLFSFGCVFVGLFVMEHFLKTLASTTAAQNVFTQLFNIINDWPILGLLVGAVAAAAFQSSTAVMGITQGLYAALVLAAKEAGVECSVTLFSLAPIVFGANIGTTLMALLCSAGGSKESKRVALFHIFYNVLGALVFMGLIFIPPIRSFLESSNSWGIDPKLQLALVHFIFNLIAAVIFMLLLKPTCNLLCKIVPGETKKSKVQVLDVLDQNILKQLPSEGIALAKQQVLSMFMYAQEMFDNIYEYLEHKKADDATFVRDLESDIDKIDRQLNEFFVKADKGDLSEKELTSLTRIIRACKDIERIGDYGENLIGFYESTVEHKNEIEDELLEVIKISHTHAQNMIQQAIAIFEEEDATKAVEMVKTRRIYHEEIELKINEYYEKSLSKKNASKATYFSLIYVDVLNSYQRVLSHCTNIAKLFGTDKKYEYGANEADHFANLSDRY